MESIKCNLPLFHSHITNAHARKKKGKLDFESFMLIHSLLEKRQVILVPDSFLKKKMVNIYINDHKPVSYQGFIAFGEL